MNTFKSQAEYEAGVKEYESLMYVQYIYVLRSHEQARLYELEQLINNWRNDNNHRPAEQGGRSETDISDTDFSLNPPLTC